jgi:HAD superfamily hydrolase (TIGR01459 family)
MGTVMGMGMGTHNIINQYDFFIFDIWGTIHDGQNFIPHAKEFIDAVKDAGKQYALLSNVPRPLSVVQHKLQSLGLNIENERIITSGDFFLHECANGNLTGKGYVVGQSLNTDLLAHANVEEALNPSDASYILYLAFADDESQIDAFKQELQVLLQYKLPFVCVNPDITVYHGDKLRYCQGYFAKFYESIGGDVLYFGKPHKKIYDHLFKKFSIDKTRAIMVGDSLATDIKGANDSEIDSILVLTGLHKDERNVANLLKLSTSIPTYILSDLKLTNENSSA